jgi:hypothetical protein
MQQHNPAPAASGVSKGATRRWHGSRGSRPSPRRQVQVLFVYRHHCRRLVVAAQPVHVPRKNQHCFLPLFCLASRPVI